MSSIDERIVGMKFDNKQFEQGVKTTQTSLDSLSKSLKLEGASKGFADVTAASKNFSLSHIEAGVGALADRFKALSIIATTALVTIAHQAVISGGNIAKSLTIDPIKSGLAEYETNLNSIQTILSNTQWQNTGLKDVNKALQILNEYSDQTIYNFGEMARNIGTFTAAGVKLDVATDAIKGIANLAAISGSNSQQAATAMYQLSQALAAGKVALIDWNSVVNAGMGGKVFQDALMETARVHGVAVDKMVKDAGGFRNTLENGWLTGQILTETLAKFTGDLTEAQLKTMGYNQQQIAGILQMGKTAQDAATKVKTMSQLIGTLQEASGSGWAKTWEIIFGDFEEAKELFTSMNNVLGDIIKNSADSRNKLLTDWKALGGRKVIIDALSNAFNALMAILKPIKEAFSQIFPPITAMQLYELSILLRDFTARLKIGGETAENLKRTFAGVFAVLGIGWDILKEVVKTFFRLLGVATEGSGDFLEFTGNIGDFLVGLRQAIKDGEGFAKIFRVVGDVLAIPIKLIKLLAGYLGSLFGEFDSQKAIKAVTGLVGKLEIFTNISEVIATTWSKVATILDDVWSFFFKLGAGFSKFFAEFAPGVSELVQNLDFSDILAGINTGLFAGLILTIRNIFGGGGTKGLFASIKESFDQLTNTMQTMQNTLRAATLLQIAIAIGVLTISVDTLSKIDAAGLTRALTAITVMFGQLLGTLVLFEKMSGFSGLAKMPLVTTALILLGVAIRILASSVKELAELNWEGLAKGLTGVVIIIGALVLAVKFMPEAPGLIASSLALVILAGAVKILASAVTDLSGLNWEEMAKGLVGVGAVLAGLALFTKFSAVEKGGVLQGAGIVLLALGIKILASAMKDFGTLSWEAIGKGLTAMAGGLVLIAAALIVIPPTSALNAAGVLVIALSLGMLADALAKMGVMDWVDIAKGLTTLAVSLTLISLALIAIPPTSVLSAAAVLIVAASLGMIAEALNKMGKMSWVEIAKGLVALAGSLGIITVAMILMTEALPGAAALLVVAASLAILAPILQLFGQMSWEEMGKGLLMLAGVFTVLGLAGLVLTPLVPTLLGLGVAITLLGVGMLLAGAGVLAFSVGLTALSVSGAVGAAALVAIISGLVGLLPAIAEQTGMALIAFAKAIATSGPAITMALVTVLLATLNAIDTITPKIIETLFKLLTLMLKKLEENVPNMVESGYKILIAFLTGIKNNIGKVTQLAIDIITAYIDALASKQNQIIQAGFNFIISFIEGLAKAVRDNSQRMSEAGSDLGLAIAEGMARGLLTGATKVTNAAKDVAKKALNAAKEFLGINSPAKAAYFLGEGITEGVALSMKKTSYIVEKSAEGIGKAALGSLSKSISGISKLVSSDMDMTPVITPVLDLSSIRRDAEEIGSMLRSKSITLGASVSAAKDASAGFEDNRNNGTPGPDDGPGGDNFTFNQYNSSPKAISNADLYRQTRNQLSVAKGVVTP